MRRAVVMPDLGAASPVLSAWFSAPGERVFAGDRLVEILIGGATVDVPAPTTGRFIEKAVLPDEPVTPGQVLGYIDEEDQV